MRQIITASKHVANTTARKQIKKLFDRFAGYGCEGMFTEICPNLQISSSHDHICRWWQHMDRNVCRKVQIWRFKYGLEQNTVYMYKI